MHSYFRTAALPVAALGAFASVALFAGAAVAAPYGPGTTVSVGTSTPVAGGTVSVSLAGFGSNETVKTELHSKVYDLGTVKANSSGVASFTAKLPSGVCGKHHIVGIGQTTHRSASTAITIKCSSTDNDNSNEHEGSDDLPHTGAQVAGIGAAGLALIAGGTLLVARRRKQNA